MRRIRQEEQIFKRNHHIDERFNNNDESEKKGAKKRKKNSKKKKKKKKKKKRYDDACAVGEDGKTDEKNSLNDIPKSTTIPSVSLAVTAANSEGQRSTRKIQKYGNHHVEELNQVEQKKKKRKQKKMKKERRQQKLDQSGVERAPDSVNIEHHDDTDVIKKVEIEDDNISLISLAVSTGESIISKESNNYDNMNADNELLSKAEQKKRKRELKRNKKKRKRQKLVQSGVDKVPGNVNVGENNHEVRISYRQDKKKSVKKRHRIKKKYHDNADTGKTVGEEEQVSLHSLAISEDRSRLSKERDDYGQQDKHELVIKTEGKKRKYEQALVPSNDGQTAGHNSRSSSQRVDEELLQKTKRKELKRKRKQLKKELVDEKLLPKTKRKELKRKIKEIKKELRRQKEQQNEGRVDCLLTDFENQKKRLTNDNQMFPEKEMADVKAEPVLSSNDASEKNADVVCTSHSHQGRRDLEYEVTITDVKDDETLQKDGLSSNESNTTRIVFPNPSKTKSAPANNWMARFQDLQQYKAEYGDCNVPQFYAPNKQLAYWVETQRKRFKLGKMTPEQVNLLVSEGFIFRSREIISWANMFNQLKAYNAEHGNCNVPHNFPSNPSLGHWVNTQRMAKKGQKSHVSESQLQALEAEGFVWKLLTRTPWAVRFEQLLQYKAKFGDCLVPQNYDENVQLGQWVSTQRRGHKAWKKGRPSPLNKERREALENVGFVWRANLNYFKDDEIMLGVDDYRPDDMSSSSGPALCCSSISILPNTTNNQSQDNSKWFTKLNELRQYREDIGNCFVPRSFPANPQLGTWVFTQKKLYRLWQKRESTSMTLERIRALEAEGFYWKNSKNR